MVITIKTEEAAADISSLGAELMSFRLADGTEYLWQGDEKYWTGRSPVLFPFVGGLRNGKTVIDGKEYEMKRHGFAKFSEFNYDKKAENSVVFTLSWNSATMSMYPFKFRFQVHYTLTGRMLRTEYVVENLDKKNMPFAVGGHPAFNCPVKGAKNFEDCEIRFSENETVGCHRVNMQTGLIHFDEVRPLLNDENRFSLKHSLFYEDALVFSMLRSGTVTLTSFSGEHGVTMDFSEFPMLGIWSAVNDAPFIALEPWTGCATCTDESDNFRKKRGIKELASNEVFRISYDVNIF